MPPFKLDTPTHLGATTKRGHQHEQSPVNHSGPRNMVQRRNYVVHRIVSAAQVETHHRGRSLVDQGGMAQSRETASLTRVPRNEQLGSGCVAVPFWRLSICRPMPHTNKSHHHNQALVVDHIRFSPDTAGIANELNEGDGIH